MAGVHIKEVAGGRFVFQFFHFIDVKRVIEGGPWTFDNSPLLIARMEDGVLPTQVPLIHLDIWVRIFDVPVVISWRKQGGSLEILLVNLSSTMLRTTSQYGEILCESERGSMFALHRRDARRL